MITRMIPAEILELRDLLAWDGLELTAEYIAGQITPQVARQALRSWLDYACTSALLSPYGAEPIQQLREPTSGPSS